MNFLVSVGGGVGNPVSANEGVSALAAGQDFQALLESKLAETGIDYKKVLMTLAMSDTPLQGTGTEAVSVKGAMGELQENNLLNLCYAGIVKLATPAPGDDTEENDVTGDLFKMLQDSWKGNEGMSQEAGEHDVKEETLPATLLNRMVLSASAVLKGSAGKESEQIDGEDKGNGNRKEGSTGFSENNAGRAMTDGLCTLLIADLPIRDSIQKSVELSSAGNTGDGEKAKGNEGSAQNLPVTDKKDHGVSIHSGTRIWAAPAPWAIIAETSKASDAVTPTPVIAETLNIPAPSIAEAIVGEPVKAPVYVTLSPDTGAPAKAEKYAAPEPVIVETLDMPAPSSATAANGEPVKAPVYVTLSPDTAAPAAPAKAEKYAAPEPVIAETLNMPAPSIAEAIVGEPVKAPVYVTLSPDTGAPAKAEKYAAPEPVIAETLNMPLLSAAAPDIAAPVAGETSQSQTPATPSPVNPVFVNVQASANPQVLLYGSSYSMKETRDLFELPEIEAAGPEAEYVKVAEGTQDEALKVSAKGRESSGATVLEEEGQKGKETAEPRVTANKGWTGKLSEEFLKFNGLKVPEGDVASTTKVSAPVFTFREEKLLAFEGENKNRDVDGIRSLDTSGADGREDYRFMQRDENTRIQTSREVEGAKSAEKTNFAVAVAEKIEKLAEQFASRRNNSDMVVRLRIDEHESLLVGFRERGQSISVEVRSTNQGLINILQTSKDEISRHLEGKNIFTNISVDPDGQWDFEGKENREEKKGRARNNRQDQAGFNTVLDAIA